MLMVVHRLLADPRRVDALGLQHGLRTDCRTSGRPDRSGAGFIGHFEPLGTAGAEQGQAVSGANTLVPFHFPTATLAYFQFVFAAITPLLFLGGARRAAQVQGLAADRAAVDHVGLLRQRRRCSGAAASSPRRARSTTRAATSSTSAPASPPSSARAILGPRRWQDRENAFPSNLMMVAVGAGILWLGWNGFNGGDPFYAGRRRRERRAQHQRRDRGGRAHLAAAGTCSSPSRRSPRSSARSTACSAAWSRSRRAPAGSTARARSIVGLISSTIVWFAWNFLSKVRPFSKVDDALGVVYTHGIAGLVGGLLVGILADPGMTEYGVAGAHYKGAGRLLGRRLVLQPLVPPALGAVPRGAVDHRVDRLRHAAIFYLVKFVLRRPARVGRGAAHRRPRDPRGGGLPRARPSVSPSAHPATCTPTTSKESGP